MGLEGAEDAVKRLEILKSLLLTSLHLIINLIVLNYIFCV